LARTSAWNGCCDSELSRARPEGGIVAFMQGAVLAGKYRVDGEIARGGMGMVLAATHLGLGEPVAIKLLLPERAQQGDWLARFRSEAKAALRIASKHV
jgi:serine/threonine-protein kinase